MATSPPQLLLYDDPPNFLVLQYGGNDIGQIKSSELLEKLRSLWMHFYCCQEQKSFGHKYCLD